MQKTDLVRLGQIMVWVWTINHVKYIAEIFAKLCSVILLINYKSG